MFTKIRDSCKKITLKYILGKSVCLNHMAGGGRETPSSKTTGRSRQRRGKHRQKGELEKNNVKVIRKFFLNHNKSFRWHLGDYENIIFSI